MAAPTLLWGPQPASTLTRAVGAGAIIVWVGYLVATSTGWRDVVVLLAVGLAAGVAVGLAGRRMNADQPGVYLAPRHLIVRNTKTADELTIPISRARARVASIGALPDLHIDERHQPLIAAGLPPRRALVIDHDDTYTEVELADGLLPAQLDEAANNINAALERARSEYNYPAPVFDSNSPEA